MPFDFSKIKAGLFNVKAKSEPEDLTVIKDPVQGEEKISFQRYGFKQAGNMNGSIEGLKICLNRVYQEHMADMRRNEAKQEELRAPFRERLHEFTLKRDGLLNQIETLEKEIIPSRKKKIEELRKDISHIRQNPEDYKGHHVGKTGYYIGVFILILLTIYLFVFYSSASYSALFKDFRISDVQGAESILTKSIFDANAISNALSDGATELILILTIPSVFIGLGYLIHKFQESKSFLKYFKITALLIVTFIFDAIIAYEITKKIYDLKASNVFETIPEYSINMAFRDVNFWLIIFAGFVVYLIWGFVFDFIIHAQSKLDIIKVRIRSKLEEIIDVEKEIKDYDKRVNELRMKVHDHELEISKLKEISKGTIIQPKEVRETLSQFMVGWYNWLSHGREYNRSDHNKVYDEFIAQNVIIVENVLNPN